MPRLETPRRLHTRLRSADCETAVSAFAALRGQGNCFLFESAEGGEHWGRYSIIGFDPAVVAYERNEALHLPYRDGTNETVAGGNIPAWLRESAIAQPAIEAVPAEVDGVHALPVDSLDVRIQSPPCLLAHVTKQRPDFVGQAACVRDVEAAFDFALPQHGFDGRFDLVRIGHARATQARGELVLGGVARDRSNLRCARRARLLRGGRSGCWDRNG